ncbi:MAG: hypothetical protein V7K68_04855 [Nostoc sp.]
MFNDRPLSTRLNWIRLSRKKEVEKGDFIFKGFPFKENYMEG